MKIPKKQENQQIDHSIILLILTSNTLSIYAENALQKIHF